jgi:hypothetical protein
LGKANPRLQKTLQKFLQEIFTALQSLGEPKFPRIYSALLSLAKAVKADFAILFYKSFAACKVAVKTL